MYVFRTLRRMGAISLALALVALTARAGDPYDIKDYIKKSFKVRPGGSLHLDLDSGNINVKTKGTSEVFVEIELSVDTGNRSDAKRIFEDYQPGFEQRGNDIFVKSRYHRQDDSFFSKWKGGSRLKVNITVQVPEKFDVDFTSGAGNINLASLEGKVNGRTGAGNITIGTVHGTVEVTSGTGNIDVNGAMGGVRINTGAGNVNVRDVQGEVNVNTGAGNIDVQITRQPRYDSRLTTGAGNVTVLLHDRIGVDVDAIASMGSASTDFPLRVHGKWMKKTIDGRLNGGGPILQLRAGVGNVELRKL